MHTTLPLLVAIVGPTAVGKTAFSLDLAQALDGEIISVDSRQIYCGMDIGTAKPSAAQRQQVPHHLLDLCLPDADFSLAQFQALAYAALDQVWARQRLPLLVGGTGQYLAAILEGWNIPHVPPQPDLRTQLYAEAENQGPALLHARLATLDPQAARKIDPSNVRRVIRALEVCLVTGQQISVLQQRTPPPYQIITLDLARPRAELYARIDQRVDLMIAEGLIAEVFGLIAAGYAWSLPAMSSLGYAEFAPLWHGQATATECIQQLKFNTHQFARKQGAWFRRLPDRSELQADRPDLVEQARTLILAASGRVPRHTDR